MTPDYDKAATLAAETLVRFAVKHSPVPPLRILEQMDNVIVISFSEISNISGIERSEIVPMFGKNRDAVTSFHFVNGKETYIVAYNSVLPFNIIQWALAREMAHIVMHHEETSEKNTKEAVCFALNLLYPRPLIHTIQATGIRFTKDLFSNLTGACDHSILCMRRMPKMNVPANLNRFVRGQFFPFAMNFFDFYQTTMPNDGSALVDLGTFMDGYEE